MTVPNGGGVVPGFLLVLFVNLCGIVFIKAVKYNSYEFGKNCFVMYEFVSVENEIYVTYNGESVESYCDDYSFQAKPSDQICVTPLFFEDPDCAVRLRYQKYFNDSTLHTITCDSGSINESYCGDSGDNLYVFFEKRGQLSTSNASFKLRLYVEEHDDSYIPWAITGGVIGSITFITCMAALICWCVCRRRNVKGPVLTPNQTGYQPASSQATYPVPQHGNPTTGLYPVGNYGNAYPMANTTAQPLYQQSSDLPTYQPLLQHTSPPSEFPEKQSSAPPPSSYDDVKQ